MTTKQLAFAVLLPGTFGAVLGQMFAFFLAHATVAEMARNFIITMCVMGLILFAVKWTVELIERR